MGKVRYRLWQFGQALLVRPLPPVAWQTIHTMLTPTEMALFSTFPLNDQWHSYRVMETLRQAGYDTPSLLVAALLHDIGKTKVRLYLWDRIFVVLAQYLWPKQIEQWGQGTPKGWRKPLVVKIQHPTWGAEMAQQAGSLPQTVALIRRHQDNLPQKNLTAEEQLLQQLQWADNQN